jgi:UDP-N-acetylglucosamine--N-acetylmuramyl-(pentapeptide) pyrophosphoryl-undecaprenol N-acetylglucosamine transferase
MAGGGTGGHVIPGIAVARELARRGHKAVFIGTRAGLETKLVPIEFLLEFIVIGGLKNLGLARRLKTLWQLPASVLAARRLLEKHAAAAVFSMGGYAAAPVVLAAAWRGTPVILMEPNAAPGMTNRRLARFARKALLSFEEAVPYFPEGMAELAGLPVREEFFRIQPKPRAELPVVLVTGGSRGSRTLNLAVSSLWKWYDMEETEAYIHVQTGPEMFGQLEDRQEKRRAAGQVVAFIDDMPRAFAAADLIVCRAGAGAVSELAAAGKPSILVPYPYAADDHQMKNALAMQRAGAARVVPDAELNGERLRDEIRACLEPGVLEAMGAAARRMARPGAAARAADLLEECSGKQ